MKLSLRALALMSACALAAPALAQAPGPTASVAQGRIAGLAAGADGVTRYLGIPYAAPPVGALRWREPQPAASWSGVRPATQFGPQCMQGRPFSDMRFRSPSTSEDCLYLNVWTPVKQNGAKRPGEKLPVLVYFYGGGFVAGDGSEYRYDGESLASRGIVVVTLNYRLGVFGFLAHPELTAESPHHASGNYGLLDQQAALAWVKANIAAFGGDPNHITIGGESAGSWSVSAQMASPLSRGMIAGAIGESGAILDLKPTATLAEAEQRGREFGEKAGAPSLAALRAMPAQQLLDAQTKLDFKARPDVDGWFFPVAPASLYQSGQAAHVPLLVGSNSQEGSAEAILKGGPMTAAAYRAAVQAQYGPRADLILSAYPAATDAEVEPAARALASDQFIAYSTWKWFDLHRRTGAATFYYLYAHPRPATKAEPDAARPIGAVHSAEIEYALGNLDSNPVYAWTSADREVSRVMEGYFANFVRTGDPNGPGLPKWPSAAGAGPYERMIIDDPTRAEPSAIDAREHAFEQAGPPIIRTGD